MYFTTYVRHCITKDVMFVNYMLVLGNFVSFFALIV